MADCKSVKSMAPTESTAVPNDDLLSMAPTESQMEDSQMADGDSQMGDSDDSMTTNQTSKTSNSRAEKQRGPKRKAKKLERAKAHAAKKGLEWKTKEALDKASAELALPGWKGTTAIAQHQNLFEKKINESAPSGEARQEMIEEAFAKEVPYDMQKWVKLKDGQAYCEICKKFATASHLESTDHIKRMEEDAIGTLMGGNAESTRRFDGDKCTGILTKKLMYTYWGDALEHLLQAAKDIHIKKGAFYDKKRQILVDECKYELGVVSYPGHGKYKNCKYTPFHELPDSEEVATEDWIASMSKPEGQGWWPVIALQHRTESASSTAAIVKSVLVVCWYQLLADGTVMAWWIYL
jgi:hypothetical protein